jgi:hypothetical protein
MQSLITKFTVSELTEQILELSRELNEQEVKAVSVRKIANETALEMGKALILLKEKVPHGEFGKYCQEKFPNLSMRQMQRYMNLFDRRAEIEFHNPNWMTELAWTAVLDTPAQPQSYAEPVQAIENASAETLTEPLAEGPDSESGTAAGPVNGRAPAKRSRKGKGNQSTKSAKAPADDAAIIHGEIASIRSRAFTGAVKNLSESGDESKVAQAIKDLDKAEAAVKRHRRRLEKRLKSLNPTLRQAAA